MHTHGLTMKNELIRDGQVVHVGLVDFYDYNQQGTFGVPQEYFEVRPGDSWRTTCTYQSTDDVVWGESTSEEMCMAFLTYYPKQAWMNRFPYLCSPGLPGIVQDCVATHNSLDFSSALEVNRGFGQPTDTCLAPDNVVNPPTASPSNPRQSEDESNVPDEQEDGLSVAAVASLSVGAALFALVVLGAVLYFGFRSKRSMSLKQENPTM